MILPFAIPYKVPDFRSSVLVEADEVVLKTSSSGKWIDILAIRDKDRVYIGTLPNPEYIKK